MSVDPEVERQVRIDEVKGIVMKLFALRKQSTNCNAYSKAIGYFLEERLNQLGGKL